MHKKKNKEPLISIIIPIYNEEKYIQKCLDSVINQTFNDFEIIVVNDGSTDSTVNIISKYKIKIINTIHLGAGEARNIGVRKALGKILVFIDADMVVDNNYIKYLIKPIFRKKCLGTYTTEEYVANIKNVLSKCWNINNGIYSNKRIIKNSTSGFVFRAILKDKFLEVGGFDTSLGYIDDRSLSNNRIKAISVNNAKCYHYNPDNLFDVYISAKWIGKSSEFKFTLKNLIRYSGINSIRVSINKIYNGAPLIFILFKIVFDLGILLGIVTKLIFKKNSK